MLPTKFQVNWLLGLGEEVKNRFSSFPGDRFPGEGIGGGAVFSGGSFHGAVFQGAVFLILPEEINISFLKIKAHEVRALSSSWAFFDKVPLSEILKAAVWNQSSTFAKSTSRICLKLKSSHIGPDSRCPKSGGGGGGA